MDESLVDKLREDHLIDNFVIWISSNEICRENPLIDKVKTISAVLSKTPTTHTWGFFKRKDWLSGTEKYAYELILFDDKALLATVNSSRRYSNPLTTKLDQESGLDKYVFSYLGTHEPYYARSNYPAFGVYIKNCEDSEKFPYCNATLRDLYSPFVKNGTKPLQEYFIKSRDARCLATCETIANHNNDVWHYLGSEAYFEDSDYINHRWAWMYEFHYREKVAIDQFDAILWPTYNVPLSLQFGWTDKSRLRDGLEQFRVQFPNCAVVPYVVHPQRPARSFLLASAKALKHHINNNRYPKKIEMNGEIVP